jgi:serine protease Do
MTVSATVIRRDATNDLAMLKVKTPFPTRYVRFETKSKAQMGEAVSIIGNPGLGTKILSHTMTQGIVSNAEREMDGLTYIQTSAAVNPGSSGSPMFNGHGKVIGMVTLKAHIEGVGFAIPYSRIAAFIDECCR